MRVLVTGGSGFIGSHVVDVLVARGHTPVNFDRIESPYSDEVETVLGDATDVDALAAAMREVDSVIHLAAMADVNDVQADPEGAELANARATLAVLEAARRAEVRRVVYGSTVWVYSDVPETHVDEDFLLAPPAHLYTATKLAGELYCRSYAALYGVEYAILRFGIPYGPRARDATVLAAFTKKALAGDALTVAGSGDQTRRFVYVEDLADGVVRAVESPAAANRIYNLAGNEDTTILEIAKTVQGLVGDTEIVHTEARAGDFGGKEISSARALEELGWRPATPFAEGARRYVEWRRARDEAPVPVPVASERDAAPVGGAAPVGVAPSAEGAVPVGLAASAADVQPARRRLGRLIPRVPRPLRPVLTAAAVTAIFFWSFASDDGLSVIAKAFPSARPVTSVKTEDPELGLIVDAAPGQAGQVADALHRDGASASIALESPPDDTTLATVQGAGSDVLPRLKPGGPLRWVGTRGQLGKTARRAGLHGHYYYVAPGTGFTLAQDLLGHTKGATPMSGALKLKPGQPCGTLERGDLVELSVSGPGWRPWLHQLLSAARVQGLRPVSAAELVQSEPDKR